MEYPHKMTRPGLFPSAPKPTGETLYADGGVVGRNPSRIGGVIAFCLVDASGKRIRHASKFLTPEEIGVPFVTNNQTELLAILHGLQSLPDRWRGTVCSDSLVTLHRLEKQRRFLGIPPATVLAWVEEIHRTGPLLTLLVSGHPTRAELAAGVSTRGHPVSEHNVWCDQKCQTLSAIVLGKTGRKAIETREGIE